MRSSWLALATKSVRIRSAATPALRSASVTTRAPVAIRATRISQSWLIAPSPSSRTASSGLGVSAASAAAAAG